MKKRTTAQLLRGVGAALLIGTRAYASPGDLYVAEATSGGHVYKFTPTGSRSTVASGIYQPVALAFDRVGNLFVGNSGAGIPPMPSTIIRIAPDGTQSTFTTIQSTQLLCMAFDGAGNLLVSTGGSVIKIAPDGTQSTFASQLHGVWPLALDHFGNVYAAVNDIGLSSILKFAPDGTSSTFVTYPAPGSSIVALVFGPSGDLFLSRGESILKVAANGTTTTFAAGYFKGNSLAFDTSGNLFAGKNGYDASESAILKFAPAGTVTTFASGTLLPSGFAFEPVTEKVRNISARGFVGSGDNVLVGGFIVGGSALANNAIVVRAIGPSLSGGISANPLADPVVELHDSSGAIVAANNDWESTQRAQIVASGLAPGDSRESAIFATLSAGNYTAVVRSADQTTGTALVEIYSVSQ
jgi:hypothetical protein